MRKRLLFLLSIWTTTIAWYIHFYPTWSGSPIPGGFGVNIDWTRYNIVQTGYIGDGRRPWTQISGYMGSQNYDFGSILMAEVNIIAGTHNLVESLSLLNAIQITGLILIPIVFLYWYYSTNTADLKSHEIYLVLLVSFFPTITTITKSSTGWYTELFATSILLFIFALLPKSRQSKRLLGCVLILIFLMTNLYRTWIFLFLFIFGTVFTIGLLISNFSDYRTKKGLPITTGTFLLASLIFFLSGTILKNTLPELIGNVFGFFINTGPTRSLSTGTEAARSELVVASSTSELLQLNLRRTFKLINGIAAALIILLYGVTRFRSMLRRENPLRGDHELILFSSLFAFPIIILVFYSYGGVGAAVTRTRYIGIYFVIFALALLFRSEGSGIRKLISVLAVLMVITAILSVAFSGYSAPHTVEEQHAITYTGSYLNDSSYVFSSGSMGPPLGYYNIRGIAIVRPKHTNWKSRIISIYYQSNPSHAIGAIRSTINDSQISKDAPPPDEFYFVLTNRPKYQGVPLLTKRTKPTRQDPRDKFNSANRVSKIYASGNSTLFKYSQ